MSGPSQDEVLLSDENDAVSGNFAACATGQTSGQMSPVVMYVMFDRSSSMTDQDKWGRATAGLETFFRDPQSAKLGVVYGVFPTETGGCDISEQCADGAAQTDDCPLMCLPEVCGEPMVELGRLTEATGAADPHEEALINAIEADDPSAGGLGTPTGPALRGALDWAIQYQAGHADESAVVVLVTDGEPSNECGDINAIADIAANGFDVSGIRTYAIGLQGSAEDTMNRIAQAGGTGDGIFIGDGDANADLLAALNTIRGDAATCTVNIPQEDSDPDRVNVTLTLASGPVDIARVDEESECGENAAWYYDNNDKPGRLLLCPATCEVVQDDTESRIEIVLGCPQTLVPAPITR